MLIGVAGSTWFLGRPIHAGGKNAKIEASLVAAGALSVQAKRTENGVLRKHSCAKPCGDEPPNEFQWQPIPSREESKTLSPKHWRDWTSKLTYVDLKLFSLIDTIEREINLVRESFPLLQAFHVAIGSRPRIKAFCASDRRYWINSSHEWLLVNKLALLPCIAAGLHRLRLR
jgi:hypothetical protein